MNAVINDLLYRCKTLDFHVCTVLYLSKQCRFFHRAGTGHAIHQTHSSPLLCSERGLLGATCKMWLRRTKKPAIFNCGHGSEHRLHPSRPQFLSPEVPRTSPSAQGAEAAPGPPHPDPATPTTPQKLQPALERRSLLTLPRPLCPRSS